MVRVLTALALLALAATASALDSRKSGDASRIANPDEAVQRALSQISKQYNGRVLSAQPIESNGGIRVRIKFLSNDGVIKVLDVDPNKE